MQAAAAASFWLLCVLGTCPLARCGPAGKFAAAWASTILWNPEATRKAASAFPQCAGFIILILIFFYLYFLKGGEKGANVWGLKDAPTIWGQMPFFFLEKEENGENGKRVPCFWALGCSQMSWSRALQLVSLRPSLMGSGREEAGEFS